MPGIYFRVSFMIIFCARSLKGSNFGKNRVDDLNYSTLRPELGVFPYFQDE